MRFTPLALICLALTASFSSFSLACRSADSGDPAANDGIPAPTGKDPRIRDLVDPSMPGHAGKLNATESISGAVVIAVDTYDETHNGKGTGDIYIEDLDSSKATPFAGIGMFAPTFTPGNLKVSLGDVLDMTGQYQESNTLGATVTFPPNTALIQFYQPSVTFRFESAVPAPVVIDNPDDLQDYAKASKYMGMLVQVNNVTTAASTFTATSGRQSIDMSNNRAAGCSDPFPKAWQITNSLMDLTPANVTQGQKLKSVVGVLAFFCNVQLLPRSMADITP